MLFFIGFLIILYVNKFKDNEERLSQLFNWSLSFLIIIYIIILLLINNTNFCQPEVLEIFHLFLILLILCCLVPLIFFKNSYLFSSPFSEIPIIQKYKGISFGIIVIFLFTFIAIPKECITSICIILIGIVLYILFFYSIFKGFPLINNWKYFIIFSIFSIITISLPLLALYFKENGKYFYIIIPIYLAINLLNEIESSNKEDKTNYYILSTIASVAILIFVAWVGYNDAEKIAKNTDKESAKVIFIKDSDSKSYQDEELKFIGRTSNVTIFKDGNNTVVINNSDISSITFDKSQKTNVLSTLEDIFKQLEKEIESQEKDIEKIEQRNKTERKYLTTLKKTIDKLGKRIESQRKDPEEIKQINETNDILKNTIAKIEKNITNQENDIEKIKQENQTKIKDTILELKKETKKEIKNLENNISKQKREIDKLKNKMNKQEIFIINSISSTTKIPKEN